MRILLWSPLGRCLLEWDDADGNPPPVPLLKNMFANERRKAKVLNFSIAYGKTVRCEHNNVLKCKQNKIL